MDHTPWLSHRHGQRRLANGSTKPHTPTLSRPSAKREASAPPELARRPRPDGYKITVAVAAGGEGHRTDSPQSGWLTAVESILAARRRLPTQLHAEANDTDKNEQLADQAEGVPQGDSEP